MMLELQAIIKMRYLNWFFNEGQKSKQILTLLMAFTIFFDVDESKPDDSGVEVADNLLSNKAAVP